MARADGAPPRGAARQRRRHAHAPLLQGVRQPQGRAQADPAAGGCSVCTACRFWTWGTASHVVWLPMRSSRTAGGFIGYSYQAMEHVARRYGHASVVAAFDEHLRLTRETAALHRDCPEVEPLPPDATTAQHGHASPSGHAGDSARGSEKKSTSRGVGSSKGNQSTQSSEGAEDAQLRHGSYSHASERPRRQHSRRRQRDGAGHAGSTRRPQGSSAPTRD
eukprot:5871288-Pleurochrysis_carterae.AAC.4